MNKKAEKIKKFIEDGNSFLGKGLTCDDSKFIAWNNALIRFLEKNEGENSTTTKIFKNRSYAFDIYVEASHSDFVKRFEEDLKTSIEDLKRLLEEADDDNGEVMVVKNDVKSTVESKEKVLHLIEKFHLVARQLRDRYDSRETLDVSDEYDVQDLFHALLYINFDDIRAEEWTPSYAGKCARQDFLLKEENIVIEIKKTRKGLSSKEIGDQLIIDIARYKGHPNCNTLICFVYDPEERINNPVGIERDLTSVNEELNVIVKIIQR